MSASVDDRIIPQGSYWAKLHLDEHSHKVASWHSLIGHCADVAACAYMLLTQTILRDRMATLLDIPSLSEPHVQRLCVLVALHDAGKVNHGFQSRSASLRFKPSRHAGHVSPLINLLAAQHYDVFASLLDTLDLNILATWFLDPRDPDSLESTLIDLLLVSWGHHGRPVGIDSTYIHHATWWERDPTRGDPFVGMRALVEATMSWFPEAFSTSTTSWHSFAHSARHAFNGLVTLADWLGSDASLFPFDGGEAEREPMAHYTRSLSRAQSHAHKMGLIPHRARRALGVPPPDFHTLSHKYAPRPLQRACEDIALPSRGSVMVLESDTGSGKTEAALIYYLRMFHAGLVDSLYFALPTRTAATQLHARVNEALDIAFSHEPDARPPVSLAVPGYLRVDDMQGMHTGRFEVRWDDAARSARGWAAESAKRYLSGAVVVGTIDQILLSTLRINHAHMRGTALLRSLIVIDEVHASDTYMSALTGAMLTHHCHQAGGHALLMSATLGITLQHDLLAAAGVHMPAIPPLADTQRVPYPLLVMGEQGSPPSPAPFAATSHDKFIAHHLCPLMEDDHLDTLLAHLIIQAEQGARVLVIRNTVKGCLATQQRLEQLVGAESDLLMRTSRGDSVAHHSRFAGSDRELLDVLIERELGPTSTRRGLIVVATQTVQQSLDLDADVMWTDLCPMDVLLQRAGRLHRHASRTRPNAHFTQPHLHVLVPTSRDLGELIDGRTGKSYAAHGVGTVYEDLRVLEATWQELETHSQLDIPRMNRVLVERTTHPERLASLATSALGAHGPRHELYIQGQQFADGSIAASALLTRAHRFEDSMFPDSLAEHLTTRLGEEDRRVLFTDPLPQSPLGSHRIATLSIPAHLCRELEGEVEPVLLTHDATHFEFTLGPHHYLYDRLGLRPYEDPSLHTQEPE